ncbi:MAG: retroviral-like aspartic protease [Planctomycetota bacterium]|jgi:hypothetical protein
MTRHAQQFPYIEIDPALGAASALPYVPITLRYGEREMSASALVDSGAALNVLPYELGLQLGAVWDQQTIHVQLSGNLAESDARALLLTGTVGQFPSVRLAFAWTQNNEVPVILGQVNFFMEFDICFFRSRSAFEIRVKDSAEE